MATLEPLTAVPKTAAAAAVASSHAAAAQAKVLTCSFLHVLGFAAGMAALLAVRCSRPSRPGAAAAPGGGSGVGGGDGGDSEGDRVHRAVEQLGCGRQNVVVITPRAVNLSEFTRAVESDSCGAVSTFSGVTRNHHDGKSVVLLRYEAYHQMALRQLLRLCADARSRWDVHSIAVAHRTGVVGVREASVVIAVSSVHRAESLEAVRFLIDSLKKIVTIWKEEHYGPPPPSSSHAPGEGGGGGGGGGGADGAAAAVSPPAWKTNAEFEQPTIGSMDLL